MRPVFLSVLLGALLLLAGARDACAQVADSEASARWIAALIASDARGTEEQYLPYSRRLAKTLGVYSAATQTEIFGFLPPSGASGNGDGSGTGDPTGGSGDPPSNYADPSEAIADPDLDSLDLLSYLLDQVPLSSSDLAGALERDPAMEDDHMKDLLLVHSPLSNGFLVSSLSNSKDNLSSAVLRDIIIANSPVKKVVLNTVQTTTKMSEADKLAVLDAQ